VGWRRFGEKVGNFVDLNCEDMSIKDQGWREKGKNVGPRREDDNYKNFDLK